jgi:murein DD-endopeptidase MepM/ murein hydrolase activator NlpD
MQVSGRAVEWKQVDHVANHRSEGRAAVRKLRAIGGTHRDAALPAGAVKVGVLGVLATATIAAPLAAAAAGIDEQIPQGESVAAQAAQAAPAPQTAEVAAAPVALPEARSAATEARSTDASATRGEERTTPADAAAAAEIEDVAAESALEVEIPEPEVAPAADAAATEEADGTTDASGSGYIKPVDAPITSGFGGRVHPVLGYFKGHDGVDFGAACGTPVKAAKAGKVVAVEYHHASGNRVKVDHGNGVVTGYYHLQGFNTSVGSTVAAGDIVGYVGSTGRSTGCHLHFAKMDEAGNYSNPMSILR